MCVGGLYATEKKRKNNDRYVVVGNTHERERERGSERLALTVYPNFKLKFALTRSSPLPGLYDAWMPAEDEPPNEWE